MARNGYRGRPYDAQVPRQGESEALHSRVNEHREYELSQQSGRAVVFILVRQRRWILIESLCNTL